MSDHWGKLAELYIIQILYNFKIHVNIKKRFECFMPLEWSVHVAKSEQEHVIDTR